MQFDSDKKEEIRSKIYYDEANKRIRINELEFEAGKKSATETIMLYETV